jgi:hypothetical protein
VWLSPEPVASSSGDTEVLTVPLKLATGRWEGFLSLTACPWLEELPSPELSPR